MKADHKTEAFVNTAAGEAPVRGFLHCPIAACADFMVLTHGAGGNSRGPLLVALADLLAESGIAVLRCDLPFRQRKATGPPSPSDAAKDQEGLRRAASLMREQFSGRAFLAGSSYGGRQATMLASADAAVADGLLLLSYPLHPPGRPTQLRTAHFASLDVPSLFVSGTRDTFGSIEELQEAIRIIPARTKLVPIEGGAHGLSQKSLLAALPAQIVQQFRAFFDS